MILVVFLLPVAIYCIVLGVINRRRRPLIIGGSWDFAGLLLAASGLILAGGPSILTGISEYWRRFWILGRLPYAAAISEKSWSIYSWLAVAYCILILAGAVWVLWLRRRQTSIYNIEPAVFEEVLAGVLDRLGSHWVRFGNGITIFAEAKPSKSSWAYAGESATTTHSFQSANSSGEQEVQQPYAVAARSVADASDAGTPIAQLELDLAPYLHHVTLCWIQIDNVALREQVERELIRGLAEVTTSSNPVGSWLLSIGVSLTCFSILSLIIVTVINIFVS